MDPAAYRYFLRLGWVSHQSLRGAGAVNTSPKLPQPCNSPFHGCQNSLCLLSFPFLVQTFGCPCAEYTQMPGSLQGQMFGLRNTEKEHSHS